jgi:hypothetical protein
MYKLSDKKSGDLIGEIDDIQLQFLVDELVEENAEDQDYYLNRELMDLFEHKVNSLASLVAMLKKAFEDKEDLEIAWTE